MTRTSARPLWILLLAASSACATLEPRLPPSHQFLERTYIFTSPSDTSIIYEAQAATHIVVHDELPRAYNELSSNGGTTTAFARRFVITPMFRVRQLHDSSAAVRTPSFMPRISYDWLWVNRIGKASGPPSVPSFDGVRVTGLRLALAHHSNGQAGCFRDGFLPLDARADRCYPAPGTDTTVVRLNRANGDFSTTYLTTGVHSTRLWRDAGTHNARQSVGGAVLVDWHLPDPMFGALTDEQRALYGSWRVRTQVEGMRKFGIDCADPKDRPFRELLRCGVSGRSRLSLEYEQAPTSLGTLARRVSPAILHYRWSAELSHSFDNLLGAGLFVRWHDGQDYYNIGFVRRRRVFMWGAMLDLGGLDYIGKKSW